MVEKSPIGTFWPQLYEPFRQFGGKLAEWIAPASEASSADDAYRITMELPGVAEEDIHLTVENGVIAVRGEKKTEREEKGDTWYFSERQYGSFQRSFRVPTDSDEAGVSADLRDGVLTITIPRKPPAEKSGKRVKISTG
ncbi:Hsp20/alpha crystallin family protein [Pararhodobacter sp. SW119]|uniref:Hsp20/alpha crystallin family protein n=1 Tax=Pararhodobacter sp. SW119 TaxID=2780075 RepID=UPI001AE08DB8|nr:Hsp20/alpha crystallin family protein [Pararhodobacter sp. SW119]